MKKNLDSWRYRHDEASFAYRAGREHLAQKNEAEAIHAFERAAELGSYNAGFHLAILYDPDDSCNPSLVEDHALARNYYERALQLTLSAAEAGNVDAQSFMGILRTSKPPVIPELFDEEDAARWWRIAIEGGDWGAALNLAALLHRRGEVDEARRFEELAERMVSESDA